MAYPGYAQIFKKYLKISKKKKKIFNKITKFWDFLEIMKSRTFFLFWDFQNFIYFFKDYREKKNFYNFNIFSKFRFFFSIFWIIRDTLGYVILQLWAKLARSASICIKQVAALLRPDLTAPLPENFDQFIQSIQRILTPSWEWLLAIMDWTESQLRYGSALNKGKLQWFPSNRHNWKFL